MDEKDISDYEFKYTMDEFIKIILFTQGYKEDINDLFDIFIEVQKLGEDIEEKKKCWSRYRRKNE